MSSIDRAATHIRDLLFHDKPVGTSHAQNTSATPTSITGVTEVELLPAPDPGYRYEVTQYAMVNTESGKSAIVRLTDGAGLVYWMEKVGDPQLGEGGKTHTFTPRRLWAENKPICARLDTASTGTVKVFIQAYKVRIDPGSTANPKEFAVPTNES